MVAANEDYGYRATYLATDYLIQSGHQKIAFIAAIPGLVRTAAPGRLSQRAWRQAGIIDRGIIISKSAISIEMGRTPPTSWSPKGRNSPPLYALRITMQSARCGLSGRLENASRRMFPSSGSTIAAPRMPIRPSQPYPFHTATKRARWYRSCSSKYRPNALPRPPLI